MEKEISKITLDSIKAIKNPEYRNKCINNYRIWREKQREQDRIEVDRVLKLKRRINKRKNEGQKNIMV